MEFFLKENELIRKSPSTFVICNKAMLSKELWWIWPACFMFAFSIFTRFIDNWWICLALSAISYPSALFVTYSELLAQTRKFLIEEAIKKVLNKDPDN